MAKGRQVEVERGYGAFIDPNHVELEVTDGSGQNKTGAKVDVVEMADALTQGPDRDAIKVWDKQNLHRGDKIMLKTKTIVVDAKDDGLYVTFEGDGAPAEPVKYGMILQAAGRAPNGKKIAAEKAGVIVSDCGFIPVDAQMRTNIPQPMWPLKSPQATRLPSTRRSSPASPAAIRKWRGLAAPKTKPIRKAARSEPPSSRGWPPVAPSPTLPTTASPS